MEGRGGRGIRRGFGYRYIREVELGLSIHVSHLQLLKNPIQKPHRTPLPYLLHPVSIPLPPTSLPPFTTSFPSLLFSNFTYYLLQTPPTSNSPTSKLPQPLIITLIIAPIRYLKKENRQRITRLFQKPKKKLEPPLIKPLHLHIIILLIQLTPPPQGYPLIYPT